MADMKRCSVELDGTIAGVSIQLAEKSLEQEERGGLSVVRRVLLVIQLVSLLLYGFDLYGEPCMLKCVLSAF